MKHGEEVDPDVLRIFPLGAGNEVGRSCIILQYRGKTVMVSARAIGRALANSLSPN